MKKINIKLTLRDGEGCQIVITAGDQTLNFMSSGTQTIKLEPKRYTALIAGFQDPAATEGPSVFVEFKQGTTTLNSITITDQNFIKPLRITVV